MTATAPPLTQTPPPRPKLAAVAYFEKPWPAAIILGTFFAITLPMAAVVLFAENGLIAWLYVWLFGITHFVITLTIYLNSANLKYFASSPKTITIFFAVPILIFLTFDLIHTFRLSSNWPILALLFFGAVRFFDFFHFNRQTFGVLQMFKGRAKIKYSADLRTAENRYLIAFVILLMLTFLAGGVCPLLQPGGPLSLANLPTLDGANIIAELGILQYLWIAAAAVTALLFAKVLRGHLRQTNLIAISYLLFQTLGGVMAALYFPLYLAALAIHYVEYHILMVPRCFHSPLNSSSNLDRSYGWLRAKPALFYAAILAVSAVVAGGAFIGMNAAMGAPISDFTSPMSYLMLIAIFDGIFVFHYFVEMYIWKFSDPHFRKMMAGLYFAPKPA